MSISKKEEVRNEKIIRGLMKLPPNRRCINCNSLGPQYVCTNFWTFVCTTCSGIHREFTHRVKSVSMSKFTSQEVDALQKGGNQRARDIYLKDWDLQRQRLPDISNVERVREFLKAVYVDKRYAGGKLPDKPPRDTQSLRSQEDETRRASSYHSYSQSPPYDYQYEERRYGKQGAVLTRKPGSDRGRYEGNISGLVYSPDRLSEQMYEDRFANESTASRVSDYSASSGGYPSKSGTLSPNFQKEAGYNSPGTQASNNILAQDVHRRRIHTFSEPNLKGLAEGIRHPQRTISSGTFGSFDSNSPSLQSVNSSNFMDVVSEPEQSLGVQQEQSWAFPSLTTLPVASSTSTSDLFQSSSIASASSGNLSKLPYTSQSTSSLQEQPIAILDKNLPHLSVPKDEGWATFDVPQHIESSMINQSFEPSKPPLGVVDALGKSHSLPSSSENMQWPSTQISNYQGMSPSISTSWHESLQEPLEKSNSLPPSNTNMQWPSSQISKFQGPSSSISASWHETLQEPQASSNAFTVQSWNAFGESPIGLHPENTQQRSRQEAATLTPSLFASQYLDLGVSESGLQDYSRDGSQISDSGVGSSVSSIPSYDDRVPSYGQYLAPVTGQGMQSHVTGIKSSNPFDIQFDSDSESSTMFPDMTSLQTALPNSQLPSTFAGGVTEQWFPQNLVTPYIPATAQGGVTCIAGQAPNSQLPTVPTQGSVASLGGNPFA